MGSPLSPVLANLYMEKFEIEAIGSFEHKPTCWLRYVDDIFVIWPHGLETLETFLKHLNNIHSNMKFTMETETNNSLSFLDVLITKSQNSFTHTVYRKPTHTNRYLHADSHHHPAQINSVLRSLIHRSIQLTDHHNRPQELKTLKSALFQNGYNNSEIDRSIRQQQAHPRSTDSSSQDNESQKAFLPYIKGVTDKIGRILKQRDIKTIYTSNNPISKFLKSPKDTISNEHQGIYEIPCSECPRTYIGQTNRRVSSRVYEHQLAVRQSDPSSALAKHHLETGHKIGFEHTKTIATERNLKSRIIREALEIERRPDCLNKRDDGRRLPNTWKPLLSRLPPPSNRIVATGSASPHTSRINSIAITSRVHSSLRSRQIETLESTSDETWGVGRLRPRRQIARS